MKSGRINGAVRVALAGGLVVLAAGAMPGCVIALGGTKHVVVAEPAVDPAKLDRIALGQTTEAELRDMLGTPNGRSLEGGKQVWTYRRSHSTSGARVVYIDEHDDEIRTETRGVGRVTIELTDGVVTAVRKE